MKLGFPIPPSKGAATVYILPTTNTPIAVTVGRNNESNLQINERSISRHHGIIGLAPDIKGLHITDMASRNGIKVRGRLIDVNLAFKARPGDTLDWEISYFCFCRLTNS